VAGTIYDPDVSAFRAIRFRPPYGAPTSLEPLAPDTDSTSFGISDSGYIGGIVSSPSEPTVARYGVWDPKGKFTTYFQGENYQALINDQNLIVLTANFDSDHDSYIVPRPGARMNLEDLLDNPGDLEAPLAQVLAINRRGDMVGYGLCGESSCPKFLLKRVVSDCDERLLSDVED
jgi:hypothetical protein